MKTRLILKLGAAAGLAALLIGCAQVPFTELKAAQKAREDAREIAQKYAPDDYNAALKLYDDARTEIEAQNGKSSFMRSYSKAADLLQQSKTGFENAQKAAEAKLAQVKGEAEEKATTASAAIDAAKEALGKVRKTSRNRADRARWKSEIDGLSATLEDANDYITSGNYDQAVGYFDTVLKECDRIQTEISGS